MADDSDANDTFFLPNFCDLRLVLVVVVLAEVLAFILALAGTPYGRPWDDLTLISLFIQWNALTGAAVLCLLRHRLARMGDADGGLMAYMLLLVVILGLSEAAFRTAQTIGLPLGQPSHLEFTLRNFAIGAIVAALTLRYLYLQHHWRRRVQAQSNARLQALQARIRPHFLFNSMNTIAALIRDQPEIAEEAVEDLADLFRASLGDGTRLVPLHDEIWLARRYLHIEQLRLGERLKIEWDIKALPPSLHLPPLTLQPLLENAVYHGIEPLPEGGIIRISGERRGDRITVVIGNPLSPDGKSRPGNRIAQENIRERLNAHFGARARLRVEQTPENYIVRLELPLLSRGGP